MTDARVFVQQGELYFGRTGELYLEGWTVTGGDKTTPHEVHILNAVIAALEIRRDELAEMRGKHRHSPGCARRNQRPTGAPSAHK